MRIFVSYPYEEDIEPFVQGLKEFLIEHDLEVVDGKWPDATVDLGDDITKKIKECDILLVVLVEHHRSRWVDQELGIARGAGLYVILISVGNIEEMGAFANQYHISRDKGDLKLFTSLTHTLNCIKKREAGSKLPSSTNAPEDELIAEDWSEDIKGKIDLLRMAFSEKAYGKALKEATQFATDHPECWRFEIAKSSALVHLRLFDDARKVLKSVLEKFSGTPRAMSYTNDNMGWLVDQESAKISRASLEESLSYFKAAKQAERRSNVYLNLVQCLLELDRVSKAEAEFTEWHTNDPDAIDRLRTQIEIEGARFVKAVSKSSLLAALVFQRRRQ